MFLRASLKVCVYIKRQYTGTVYCLESAEKICSLVVEILPYLIVLLYHFQSWGVKSVSIHAPAWSATFYPSGSNRRGHSISTHAPREGCDQFASPVRETMRGFQLPHPVRGATRRDIRQNWTCLISIPAPREGYDFFNML